MKWMGATCAEKETLTKTNEGRTNGREKTWKREGVGGGRSLAFMTLLLV